MKQEAIWDKFVESSQLIESSLNEFDLNYHWGSDPTGEPGRRTNRASNNLEGGLRHLYCYWLDRQLASIEARADNWVRNARSKFEARYGNDARGVDWLATEMDATTGSIKAGGLRFPPVIGSGHQPTGIWTRSNYDRLFNSQIGAAGPF